MTICKTKTTYYSRSKTTKKKLGLSMTMSRRISNKLKARVRGTKLDRNKKSLKMRSRKW